MIKQQILRLVKSVSKNVNRRTIRTADKLFFLTKAKGTITPVPLYYGNLPNEGLDIQLLRGEHNGSEGLLEIIPEENVSIQESFSLANGDFSSLESEHFAHVLNFTKADIDISDFNISEIETVLSQSVDNIEELYKQFE